MTIIYLVRHGETIFNAYRRMQGWCDTPLTDNGINQAKNLGYGLRDIVFDKAYSSDSGRAIKTTQFILEKRNISYIFNENLREMFFGEMEGRDIQTKSCKDFIIHSTKGWSDVGGENYKDLGNRLYQEIQKIAKMYDGNILIVSHGVSIKSFISIIDPKCISKFDLKNGTLENCSVTKVLFEKNGFKLLKFNDITYEKNGGKLRYEENYK